MKMNSIVLTLLLCTELCSAAGVTTEQGEHTGKGVALWASSDSKDKVSEIIPLTLQKNH